MITAANNNWAKYFQRRAMKCRHEPSGGEKGRRRMKFQAQIWGLLSLFWAVRSCDPINLSERETFFNFKWNWITIWTRFVETSRLSALEAFSWAFEVFKAFPRNWHFGWKLKKTAKIFHWFKIFSKTSMLVSFCSTQTSKTYLIPFAMQWDIIHWKFCTNVTRNAFAVWFQLFYNFEENLHLVAQISGSQNNFDMLE